MPIEFLLDRFTECGAQDAVIWRDRTYSYSWLNERIGYWRERIAQCAIKPGAVVAVEADFSPDSITLFLALAGCRVIVVPMTASVSHKREEFLSTGEVEHIFSCLSNANEFTYSGTGVKATHQIFEQLRERNVPGLILFSSGSTGKSKAAVHDLSAILQKYHTRRPALRMISFLLYDHIGGVNTMLHTLSNGGCLITVADRTPETVLRTVESHKVEVLPTSPTFLNLILLSRAWENVCLDSLKTVTYGTEPMPESTLKRFHELFPKLKLQQTYGLSEVGILRSQSRSSDSLWVKVGGEGFETRIVDGLFEIKAASAMLGYLNATSPFTEDGWFKTGDQVEVDGEYIRFLGRKSEIINVGGEKVFPAEVENVILEVENVAEVTVFGERSPIMGQIVCARIRPHTSNENSALIKRIKLTCRKHLQPFKIPVKIHIDLSSQANDRFKKERNPQRLACVNGNDEK